MAHITQATDVLTTVTRGPFAIVRGCRICDYKIARRSGRGRGSGLCYGNKQRGEMHQHMKTDHPNALAAMYDFLEADGFQSCTPNHNINDFRNLDD